MRALGCLSLLLGATAERVPDRDLLDDQDFVFDVDLALCF
jgi:hypothetical protein